MSTESFNKKQTEALEYVVDHIKEEKQFLLFIYGSGGVGKTFFLRTIVRKLENDGHLCATLAYTGIAACVLGGRTIHSFFHLPFKSRKYYKHSLKECFLIQNLKVLIIDEVSMLDECTFDFINYLLKKIRNSQNDFGGLSLILSGDPAQLPVIRGKNIWKGKLFFKFERILFNEIIRQNDKFFQDILEAMRFGKTTPAAEKACEARMITLSEENFNKDEDFFLTPTRKSKNDFNRAILETIDNEEFVSIAYNEKTRQPYDEEEKKISENPFQSVLRLKLNCRVMMVANVNVECGWANGTLAKVIEINDSQNIIKLSRLKDNVTCEVMKYRFEMEDEMEDDKDRRVFHVSQFPLDVAYALTIHKTQGLTLEKAILDIGNVWEGGQAYVALSRVRSLDNVKFTSFDKQKIFTSKSFDEFQSMKQFGEKKKTDMDNRWDCDIY